MFIIKTTHEYEKWYASLKGDVLKARISIRLRKIEDHGHFGDIAGVGYGVYELRFFFGAGYRIYYIIKDEVIIILLAGGDKSTQPRDIQKAKELAKELK